MGITLKKIEKWESKKKTKKLLSALNIDDKDVRIGAIRALSNFDTLEVINALANLLRDPNPDIRLVAVESLGKIGSPKATEFIRFMLEKETDRYVINAAKYALSSIKERSKQEETA
ncbi:MAG: HEAT repeat domain-containing protein [Clostridiaceae bacterium]|jgi:HEAT repeat protein|nr:HEAT repeat domain-containing protein [Clostridiaceae bacterium]